MKFEKILFVLHGLKQDETDSLESPHFVSCRLVRPFSEILADPRPLNESIDASIITMCVEQAEETALPEAYKKVFHVHADNVAGVPEGVKRFFVRLGYIFDPDIPHGLLAGNRL